MEASPLGPTVIIHGDEWPISHIREDVNWFRAKSGWELRKWSARFDVASNGPATSSKPGQRLVNKRLASPKIDGHDHCGICWWTLSECGDPAANQGYTYDGRTWVCVECFGRFIGPGSATL